MHFALSCLQLAVRMSRCHPSPMQTIPRQKSAAVCRGSELIPVLNANCHFHPRCSDAGGFLWKGPAGSRLPAGRHMSGFGVMGVSVQPKPRAAQGIGRLGWRIAGLCAVWG